VDTPVLSSFKDPDMIAAFVAAFFAVVYGILLIELLRRRAPKGEIGIWLQGFIAASLLGMLPHAVLESSTEPFAALGNLTQPALTVYLAALVVLGFSRLSLRFLDLKVSLLFTAAGLAWFAALLYVGFNAEESLILGTPGWVRDAIEIQDVPALVAIGGWGVMFAVHMLVTLNSYRTAHLPELSNRMLFWTPIIPLLFLGIALGVSGTSPWREFGWLVQCISVAGAVYGVAAQHRIADVRHAARQTLHFSLMTLITAGAILLLLLGAQVWSDESSFAQLGILAFVAALLFAPLRRLAEWVFLRLTGRMLVDPTQALRRYSQEIISQIDLEQLNVRLVETLTTVLNIRTGTLILARSQNGQFSLEPLSPALANRTGRLAAKGPIYQALCVEQDVLLQYDLEYQDRFIVADPEERAFFARLRMNAYAPILVDNELIGLIACGPKANEAPFYVQELELLITIANQTGTALRNARLVADLRTSQESTAKLNESLNQAIGQLGEANEQLERLDSVKSDFITIASHELRTPLAQIRGYTDIMQALSEQGILDENMIYDMTAKIRKATGRLEVLISDMLDVSQLDVNAMDLRFVESRVESVMRMAIEPLTDALNDRKITLGAYGLRSLPTVKADLERLVQAFRNIIVNAIKYTPDGGSIEIIGRVHEHDSNGNPVGIELSIADTGVGINPEHQDLIFEKFFRGADPSLHSTGATKFMGAGPGLGLTIARGVIEGHGGRIWCESEGFDPENFPGSTFYIILPVVPPEDASRVLPFEKTDVATPAPVT
jgi:signal transduction histidine kinase